MAICLIGLGANLGDCAQTIDRAGKILRDHPQVTSYAQSKVFATKPIGGPAGQNDFLNAAARLETTLSPEQLLALLKQTEADLGRRKTERWGPREIDLDLLLYGDMVLQTTTLQVPHPRMAFRRFVLQPAANVAAKMVHPQVGWTVTRLLEHLDTVPHYVAITGAKGVGKTDLAEKTAEQLGTQLLLDPLDKARLEYHQRDRVASGLEFECELITRRAELLGGSQRLADGGVMVSDFWTDQSLAYGRLWLSDERYIQLEQTWNRLRQDTTPVKLCAILEASTAHLVQAAQQRDRCYEREASAAWLDQLQAILREQVMRPSQGPWLRLPASDPAWALDELVSAIQAMQ